MWTTGEWRARLSGASRVVAAVAIATSVAPLAAGQDLSAPKRTALEWIEANERDLVEVSHDIWEYSEIGLEETQSVARLTALLEANGFEVEDGVAGMPTAFIGSYGSGEPIIGFLAEYDALPGVSQAAVPERQPRPEVDAGHGCGHNLYSTASTAAAIAVKRAMEAHGLPGTVRLYGTPAEETLIGKIYMARADVFEDLDAAFSWHPGDRTGASYDYSKGPGVREVPVSGPDRSRLDLASRGPQRARRGRGDELRCQPPAGARQGGCPDPLCHHRRGRPAQRGPGLRRGLVLRPRGQAPGRGDLFRPRRGDRRGRVADDANRAGGRGDHGDSRDPAQPHAGGDRR